MGSVNMLCILYHKNLGSEHSALRDGLQFDRFKFISFTTCKQPEHNCIFGRIHSVQTGDKLYTDTSSYNASVL